MGEFVRDKKPAQSTSGDGFVRDKREGYWTGVGERGKAMARAGIEGVTLGLVGRGAAALNSWMKDEPYDTAWAEQQQMRKDAGERLDRTSPGAYKAIEFGSSLLPILATGGAAALPETSSLLARGGATLAEGAAGGAASAYGHGQDPLLGAGVGAAGGAVPGLSALTARLAPAAGRVGGGAKGLALGGPLGAYGGWKLGGKAGDTTKDILQATTEGPTGRSLLAAIASSPGRLYGWATGQ